MRAPIPSNHGVRRANAKACDVNIRARIGRLSNVNTMEGTACPVVTIYYYWNDPRMIGYPYTTLPVKLWVRHESDRTRCCVSVRVWLRRSHEPNRQTV